MKAWKMIGLGAAFGLLAALALSPSAQTRVTSGVKQYIGAMPADKCHQDTLGACQTWGGGTTTYYTTAGDKQLPAGGVVSVFAGNAGNTVTFYDDADGTCSSNQKSGAIALTADAPPLKLEWEFSNGICMTLANAGAAEVTVVTLP